jgi:hypothetical protein
MAHRRWCHAGVAGLATAAIRRLHAPPLEAGINSYISPYFVTNADKMRVEMDDVYILIYEKKLSSLNELLPLLEAICRPASRSSSLRKTSKARLSPPSLSTVCAAASRLLLSRLRASAIAARRCCRTSQF